MTDLEDTVNAEAIAAEQAPGIEVERVSLDVLPIPIDDDEPSTERTPRREPCLVFDIETRPDAELWADEEFVASIREECEAPGTWKDPDKIKREEDRQFDARKAKAACSWYEGRVACIGWTVLGSDRVESACYADEGATLKRFADSLFALGQRVVLGGFNVRRFDVPFVTMRAAIYGVALPRWWPKPTDWWAMADPYSDLFDRQGSLAAVLRAFRWPPKTHTAEESLSLSLPELAAYCRQDVAREAALIWRLRDRFECLRAREES